jgi:hypothetical protein
MAQGFEQFSSFSVAGMKGFSATAEGIKLTRNPEPQKINNSFQGLRKIF